MNLFGIYIMLISFLLGATSYGGEQEIDFLNAIHKEISLPDNSKT